MQNSTQEEFRSFNGEVKHFDKNGNEYTKTYYLRKKIIRPFTLTTLFNLNGKHKCLHPT